MIYLIIGRSGSGKDYLAKKLEDRGLNVVKSYKTAEPRSSSDDTHIFITKEEAKKYTDRVAETVINDIEYFATREQVENSDVYIINPEALNQLLTNMPDTCFHIVHIQANTDENCKTHAIDRADDKTAEIAKYEARKASENAQFTAFEKAIEDSIKNGLSPFPENVRRAFHVMNDYQETTLSLWAELLLAEKRKHDNMMDIVDDCVHTLHLLMSDKPNHVIVRYGDTNENKEKSVPYDLFADTLLSEPDSFHKLYTAILQEAKISLDVYPSPEVPKSE